LSSFAVLKNNIMITTIYKIGVTGSAGSGKSLVCRRFAKLGLYVISSDKIARQVVEKGMPAYKKLVDLFGSKVLLKNGSLNRPVLRKIISSNPHMKAKLENIVQPEILRELFSKIQAREKKGDKIVVAEVPLLFELDLKNRFNFVITVAADENKLKQRIAERDGVTENEAEKFLTLQMPQQLKIQKSDKIIWNNGGIEALLMEVDKIYSEIINSFIDISKNLT